MKRSTLSLAIGLVMVLPALSTAAEPAEGAATDLAAAVEVSEEDALQDDILIAIDLPIVVADARDAGVEEEELAEVITTAAESDLAVETTVTLLEAETEATKTRGKRKGLSRFVRMQISQGVPPKEIATKIRDREEKLEEMSPEERAALEKRIEELRDINKRRRKALNEKRKALKAAGKEIKVLGKEVHAARRAALVEHKKDLEKARREHRAARAEHSDARGGSKEAREDHREAKEDAKEAREDLKAAETPEERREAKKDLKDAKKDLKDTKQDKKHADREREQAAKAHHDAKKEHKGAKKEHKGAKKEHKDAKKDAKKGKKG